MVVVVAVVVRRPPGRRRVRASSSRLVLEIPQIHEVPRHHVTMYTTSPQTSTSPRILRHHVDVGSMAPWNHRFRTGGHMTIRLFRLSRLSRLSDPHILSDIIQSAYYYWPLPLHESPTWQFKTPHNHSNAQRILKWLTGSHICLNVTCRFDKMTSYSWKCICELSNVMQWQLAHLTK